MALGWYGPILDIALISRSQVLIMAEVPEPIADRQIALAPILPHAPRFSSVDSALLNLEGQGITLEHFHYPPFETPEYTYPDHKIAIHTRIAPDLQVKRKLDGRVQYELVLTEQVIVVPAQVSHQVQWDRSSEFLILTLKPEVLRQAVGEIAPDRVDLVPKCPQVDPLIQQLGLALKAELETHGNRDRLYIESLVNCLALQLLKKCSAVSPTFNPKSTSLSQTALRQVIDYVDEHLGQNLKLRDLAELAGMSTCYFASLFKQATGQSPHQFIVQRRLARSRQLLRSDGPIADIALQCGFSSQSHLTRLFRKQFGTTPKAYRDALS